MRIQNYLAASIGLPSTHPKRCRRSSVVRWPLAAVLACSTIAGCTPEAYHGTPPPFYLQPLPMDPRVGPDGELDRARLTIAPDGVGEGVIPVQIEQVLRASVLTHPRVQAILETVVQTRADHVTASLLPNPSLGIGYSLAPFPGKRFNATSRQGGPPQLDLGLGLLVDSLLFGKRAAAIRVAELDVDVVLAQYADVGRQLMLGAIDSHFSTLLADALHRSLSEEAEQMHQFVDVLRQQVELGAGTLPELDRARTALALLRRRLVLAEAERDNSLTRFRTFLAGVDGGDRAVPLAAPESTALVEPSLDQLLTLADENRPDLVAARREVARSRAAVLREQSNAWPWLRVTPGFTRQYQSRAIGFPDVNSWGIGAEATLPLFDRNQGNIAAAESLVRQAELALMAQRIDVHSEVSQALRDLLAARASVAIVDQTAIQAAQRAREGTEAAHALGSRTLLEVLDARAAFREVQREQVRTRLELQRTASRLAAVVGAEIAL